MSRDESLVVRVLAWSRLVLEYVSAGVVARALAAGSGLLTVRLLSLEQYAELTLALSAFGFMCTFSDLGATESLGYFRRRSAELGSRWFQYVQVVRTFRRWGFCVGAAGATLYLVDGLTSIGSPTWSILLTCCLTLLAAWNAIHAAVTTYVLRLLLSFRDSYATELISEVTKVAVVLLLYLLSYPNKHLWLGGLVAATWLSASFASRRLLDSITPEQVATPRKRHSRLLCARTLPAVVPLLQFAAQGALVVWIASHAGRASVLAEYGAVTRLGVLYSFAAGFVVSVVVPRVAAVPARARFIRLLLLGWALLLSTSAMLLAATALAPAVLLAIVGPTYQHLTLEVVLAAATAVAWSLNGYAWSINRVRGWMSMQTTVSIAITLAQIMVFIAFDFGSTVSVLWFGFVGAALWLFAQVVIQLLGIAQMSMKKEFS